MKSMKVLIKMATYSNTLTGSPTVGKGSRCCRSNPEGSSWDQRILRHLGIGIPRGLGMGTHLKEFVWLIDC